MYVLSVLIGRVSVSYSSFFLIASSHAREKTDYGMSTLGQPEEWSLEWSSEEEGEGEEEETAKVVPPVKIKREVTVSILRPLLWLKRSEGLVCLWLKLLLGCGFVFVIYPALKPMYIYIVCCDMWLN